MDVSNAAGAAGKGLLGLLSKAGLFTKTAANPFTGAAGGFAATALGAFLGIAAAGAAGLGVGMWVGHMFDPAPGDSLRTKESKNKASMFHRVSMADISNEDSSITSQFKSALNRVSKGEADWNLTVMEDVMKDNKITTREMIRVLNSIKDNTMKDPTNLKFIHGR
jgi:hypothetical protein